MNTNTSTTPDLFDLIARLEEFGLAEHGGRVSELAAEVCHALGVSDVDSVAITVAGLVHDVGKIELSPRVTEHPERGERLVYAASAAANVAATVRHHHERWDGRGYPDRLRGRDIPLGARIVAVCDTYDRLLSRGASPDDAMTEVAAGIGSRFDPEVAVALLGVLARRCTLK